MDLTRFGGYLISTQKGDPLCHQHVPLSRSRCDHNSECLNDCVQDERILKNALAIFVGALFLWDQNFFEKPARVRR